MQKVNCITLFQWKANGVALDNGNLPTWLHFHKWFQATVMAYYEQVPILVVR